MTSTTDFQPPDPLIPWLDTATDALVRDMVVTLVERHADLLAVILYGSVARQEERGLADTDPSDVDLLLLFDTDDDLVAVHQGRYIIASLGAARERHLDAPREVQVMIASRSMREWDPTFVAHVGRDGHVLYAHGPWTAVPGLPDAIAQLEVPPQP